MTVPSTRFREDYAGNGSATSFPYAFRIFKNTDLVVTKTDNSGNETTLTLGTDYTVTGAGSYNGGAVVLTTALPTSYRLTIERVLAIRQDTDLRNQGEFLAETHEDAFDRLTMIVQRLAGYLGMGQDGTLRTLLLGTGDVDGAGAFRARQNRIQDLGDPVNMKDAANKQWTLAQIAASIFDGVGNALLQLLASSDQDKGAALVQYRGRTVSNKMLDVYSLRDETGAALDGVADITSALNAAMTKTKRLLIDGPARITGAVNIPANITLEFIGNGEIKRDGNAATLQATSQPGIKLIRPNLTWVSGTAEHGTFTLCDDMEVHHPIIKGSGKAGGAAAYLLFKGCADLKVYEPIARNNAGLVFDSSDGLATGTWGARLRVYGGSQLGAHQGITILHQRDWKFFGTTGGQSSGTYGVGFDIEYQNEDGYLIGCVARDNLNWHGFYIEGNISYGIKRIHLIGCDAYGNGQNGFQFDANHDQCSVSGGTSRNNGGDGVFSSGGRRLTVTGLDSGNNTKSGLNFNAPFYYRANHNDLHDNGRYGLEISAVGTNNDFQFNQYANNTLGETTGITEAQNNLIADQPWTVYTPNFYKADGTTTFSPTAQDFRFKRIGTAFHVQGSFTVPASTLDGTTYISLPIVGAWIGDTSRRALALKGIASCNSTGIKGIDGAFYNDRLRIAGGSSTDTDVRVNATLEI